VSGSLAETIQGEAGSDPAAQFAVASTIFNRQQAGTFPGGSSLSAIVNAPLQFVGYNPSPNANAQSLATALQNGTLSSYGNVGNAVNFQSGATAANNGFTNGGANIGGNYFSDRFGSPTSNFQAPVYGGSAGGTGTIQNSDFIDPDYDYGSAGTSGASSGASMGDTYSLFGNPSTASDASSGYNALSPGSTGLGSGSGLFGGSAATAGGSDNVTYDTSGFNPDTTDWNVFDDGTSSAASSASSASSAASAAGGGAPVDITDLPGADKAISGAGQAVQTGANTIGQNVETSAGGIVGTATSIFNKGQSYISGAVVIVALIVLGLIFIAFGLGMFRHDVAAVA
jgi:hypothetical protein